MGRPDSPRSIIEFQDRFASEAACLEYLAACRWPDGFVCPGCRTSGVGAGAPASVAVRGLCAADVGDGRDGDARHAHAVADVVLGGLSAATHHPGISAKQLQRRLAVSRYETAWLILQKLRRAMIAPERGLLSGEVEIDEFFLGGHEDGLKGGRQHGKKALIGAAIEVRGQGSGRLGLQVLRNSRAVTLEAFTKATTATGAVAHTDGLFSYNGLRKLGYEHRPRKVATVADDEQLLPRVHRAISRPQGLDARNPPRRLIRAPARLPRRIRLPTQPPRHADGRLPDPARAQRPTRPHDLRPDHRSHKAAWPTGCALDRLRHWPVGAGAKASGLPSRALSRLVPTGGRTGSVSTRAPVSRVPSLGERARGPLHNALCRSWWCGRCWRHRRRLSATVSTYATLGRPGSRVVAAHWPLAQLCGHCALHLAEDVACPMRCSRPDSQREDRFGVLETACRADTCSATLAAVVEFVMVLLFLVLPAALGFVNGRPLVLLVPVALVAVLVAITLPDALTPAPAGYREPNIRTIYLVFGLVLGGAGFLLCLIGIRRRSRRESKGPTVSKPDR